MTNKLMLFLFCFMGTVLWSQSFEAEATRIKEDIKVDGILDEVAWSAATPYDNFTKLRPNPGKPVDEKTTIKFIYNDDALYIGAFMAEDPANIQEQITERDQLGQADAISFIIDTYQNATSAMEFVLTVAGTQMDSKWSTNGQDWGWDEVWDSGTSRDDKGWYAEFRIPYAALRFPKVPQQEWNFQIIRVQSKKGQRSSFFPVKPDGPDFLAQAGTLKGIENIKPPIRLSLYPYLSTYLLHSSDQSRDPVHSVGGSYNAGLDVKYGINDAFTLQSTLIPDFGQVRSDDRILNLSPFEQRFDENRAFFTEGTEIFSKADLFYSRRIGERPVGYWKPYDKLHEGETVEKNPQAPQLLNATKLSGRTNAGTGIGFFNAIEGASFATIRNQITDNAREEMTAPITNYNIVVVDQNLPNNSSFSIINTNVFRAGPEYNKANVIGTEFGINNKKQNYGISGSGSYSSIFGEENTQTGWTGNYWMGKTNGNYRFGIGAEATSPHYDNNDLGINFETNVKEFSVNGNYSFFEPWLYFNQANFWTNLSNNSTYDGNMFLQNHLNMGFWTETKKQWQGNMWFNVRSNNNNIFEPRRAGWFLRNPGFVNSGYWISSDRRKRFYMSTFGFAMNFFEPGRHMYEAGLGPNWIVTDKFKIEADLSYTKSFNEVGWVNFVGDDIIMGQRDRVTISNQMTMDYNFTKTISLNARFRHYWSSVFYDQFYDLQKDGSVAQNEYDGHHDANFNIFNMDLNFRWRFAPGSDLFIVWKSNIFGYNTDESIDFRELNYMTGLSELSDNPQNNSISVRAVYFLDYYRTTQAMKKRKSMNN